VAQVSVGAPTPRSELSDVDIVVCGGPAVGRAVLVGFVLCGLVCSVCWCVLSCHSRCGKHALRTTCCCLARVGCARNDVGCLVVESCALRAAGCRRRVASFGSVELLDFSFLWLAMVIIIKVKDNLTVYNQYRYGNTDRHAAPPRPHARETRDAAGCRVEGGGRSLFFPEYFSFRSM
jgi:hypothetical protein